VHIAPNVVVFVVSRFPSHVLGTMGLARRLAQRGYDVEFWGHAVCRDSVRTQGFVFRELKGIWPFYEPFSHTLWPTAVGGGFLRRRNRMRALGGALSAFERSLQRHLAIRIPRVAIFDPFEAPYHPYFEEQGIECVVLNDKPPPICDSDWPPPTSSLVPTGSLLGRGLVQAAWALQRLQSLLARSVDFGARATGAYTAESLVNAIQNRVTPLAASSRVHRGIPYDVHYRHLAEWILSAPELDFPRSSELPSNVRYVGPCTDTERNEAPAPIARDGVARFLVYVAMGVSLPTWKADLRLLRQIVAALGNQPSLQVVIAAGHERAAAALTGLAPNVQAFAFLPQLSLLAIADLAITHAGANTFRECIANATPMLAFPRHYDQPGVAARIVHHGIGLRGSRRLDSPASIRGKVFRILHEPAFRARIAQLRETVRASETRLLSAALGSLEAAASTASAEPLGDVAGSADGDRCHRERGILPGRRHEA
jgi:UDP:flavonoid glycosyltransferase YjiC (YdhE family)